ncbi:hypothetical protein QTP88_005561 [Uroleucon formosanum]
MCHVNNIFTISAFIPERKERKDYLSYMMYRQKKILLYDFWSRYLNDLLSGRMHHIGVYSECIDVHLPVQGQYCMTSTQLNTDEGRLKKSMKWKLIITLGTKYSFIDYEDRYRRNKVKIGTCIPDSCTPANLENVVSRARNFHLTMYNPRSQSTPCMQWSRICTRMIPDILSPEDIIASNDRPLSQLNRHAFMSTHHQELLRTVHTRFTIILNRYLILMNITLCFYLISQLLITQQPTIILNMRSYIKILEIVPSMSLSWFYQIADTNDTVCLYTTHSIYELACTCLMYSMRTFLKVNFNRYLNILLHFRLFSVDILPKYLYRYSVIYNGRNLIKHDKNNDLNVFNGFKALTMMMILFGHKFVFHSTSLILYTMNNERILAISILILYSIFRFIIKLARIPSQKS